MEKGRMMEFERLATTWNELGKQDPLWAILTHPKMEDGRWQHDQFFLSGQLEIEAILEEIQWLPFPLVRGRALDFGCGVGRLSQALGAYFGEVHGVDVAPSMIELADSLNRSPEKVTYHVNRDADLRRFEDQTFDFIYTRLVLQHINPVYSKKYIAEFVRLLKPGGLAVFQVPWGFGPKQDEPLTKAYLQPSARFTALISADTRPLTLWPKQSHDLAVRVRNESRSVWLSAEDSGGRIQINLGNHWLRRDGFVFLTDDARVGIPATMAPRDETELRLRVTAPSEAGAYLLEVDLVQEQTAWFGNRGSPTVRIQVEVEDESAAEREQRRTTKNGWTTALINRLSALQKREQPATEKKPRFEMHGVPAAEVIQIVRDNGGRMVAMQHDGATGQDWQGFLYFITKKDG
jgi:SAM-dependent methyltransferase